MMSQTLCYQFELEAGIYMMCVYSVCLIWQESVELLGAFKEFMTKHNKVYSSQEGERTHQISASAMTVA